MPKYVFAYHGGGMAESEAAQAEAMAAWGAWFESLGAAVIDGGNPTGQSKTITPDHVEVRPPRGERVEFPLQNIRVAVVDSLDPHSAKIGRLLFTGR